eukprot:CCRYP_008252-RA/>CCRYP_008252-RA protein AED:0.49 eAED:0.44 QI:0/0/0/0.5/0/0/2/0/92
MILGKLIENFSIDTIHEHNARKIFGPGLVNLRVNIDAKAEEGFTVRTALMDKEFNMVVDKCFTFPINAIASNKHIPEIEHKVYLVKEQAYGK